MSFMNTPKGWMPQGTSSASLLHDTMPAGVYNVTIEDGKIFYKPTTPMNLPRKVYGDVLDHTSRILDTFMRRSPKNTSALFSGVPGSGKTLLSRNICKQALELYGLPVLVLNDVYDAEQLAFITSSMPQSKIILIDEIDKIYANKEDMTALITTLDGLSNTHTLFLLTSNKAVHTLPYGSALVNRPGRIYFNIVFEGISTNTVEEYCEDNLDDLSKLPQILDLHKRINNFTMDMVSALVDEMNAYPSDSIETILTILNIKAPLFIETERVDVAIYKDSVDVTQDYKQPNKHSLLNSLDEDYNYIELVSKSETTTYHTINSSEILSNTIKIYTEDGIIINVTKSNKGL